MDLFSLVSDIDRLLEATELDPQKVYPLLMQVRSYLLTLQPPTEQVCTSEEIIVTERIDKLTDLLDFPGKGWSLALEDSTSNISPYLLEEETRKAYPLQSRSQEKGSSLWDSLDDILNNLQSLNSPELPPETLKTALGEIKRVILCCPTWRHETVRLQIEQMLKIPDICWLNPPITLLLSHLEKLEPLPTVVIWTGEKSTEFALINLPKEKKILSSCFWRLGAIKYGQEALLQDIFSYLIYPQWEPQFAATLPKLYLTPARVGQADPQTRSVLQTQLESHPLGSTFLKSSLLIQNILQRQNYFASQLQGKTWGIKRSDYEDQILSYYLEYLQESIQDNLKISFGDIQQVVWGGTLLESIDFSYLPWSNQIFPNAKFFNGLDLVPGLATVLNYPALFV